MRACSIGTNVPGSDYRTPAQRPESLPLDPVSQAAYEPGELAQRHFWFLLWKRRGGARLELRGAGA
jgi:hypothetical protein